MGERKAGIIMNGVTGRMGLNQHLIRSILAIRVQGGLTLADGSVLMPDYTGPIEVEIFNRALWDSDPEDVLTRVIERFEQFV